MCTECPIPCVIGEILNPIKDGRSLVAEDIVCIECYFSHFPILGGFGTFSWAITLRKANTLVARKIQLISSNRPICDPMKLGSPPGC